MLNARSRAVGGFRDDLIAGEEPELCVRLRAAGWRIWRLLESDMAFHDAAMFYTVRPVVAAMLSKGVATLSRKAPICTGRRLNATSYCGVAPCAWLWGSLAAARLPGSWNSIRALGLGRLASLSVASVATDDTQPWVARRSDGVGTVSDSCALRRKAVGQIKFMRDRLLDRQAPLIEYRVRLSCVSLTS